MKNMYDKYQLLILLLKYNNYIQWTWMKCKYVWQIKAVACIESKFAPFK